MNSGHEVLFLDDGDMPEGMDWLLVDVDGEVHCVVRRSRVVPCVLEDAWAGYRHLAAVS